MKLPVLGYGVVIVKNGHRICGSGAALANAPIQQNKAYFEAKMQSTGKSRAINCFTVLNLLSSQELNVRVVN